MPTFSKHFIISVDHVNKTVYTFYPIFMNISLNVLHQQHSVQLQQLLQTFRSPVQNSWLPNKNLTKFRSLLKEIWCILTDKWNDIVMNLCQCAYCVCRVAAELTSRFLRLLWTAIPTRLYGWNMRDTSTAHWKTMNELSMDSLKGCSFVLKGGEALDVFTRSCNCQACYFVFRFVLVFDSICFCTLRLPFLIYVVCRLPDTLHVSGLLFCLLDFLYHCLDWPKGYLILSLPMFTRTCIHLHTPFTIQWMQQ